MLNPTEVLKSDIVANSTMNRSRGLSGVNSYAKDLRFDVLDWLVRRCEVKSSVVLRLLRAMSALLFRLLKWI